MLGIVTLIALVIATIPKRYNILIIGSDQRADERGRSDVLMVLSLTKSPAEQVSLITVPRDTRVDIPDYGTQKITHAYALGDRPNDGKELGNRDLTVATMEQFLSISIHGTAEFTFTSFAELVDHLGGVTVDGKKLSGEDALKIVRDRYREGGDFARTADQREIVGAVLQEIKAQGAYADVYGFLKDSKQARIMLGGARFGLFSAYAALRRGGQVQLSTMHTDVIPGHGERIYTPAVGKELYYWIPNEPATAALVHEWLS